MPIPGLDFLKVLIIWALLGLLSGLGWASSSSKEPQAQLRRQRLDGIFAKIVQASKSPEFLVWYDGPGLIIEPVFDYADQELTVHYDCASRAVAPRGSWAAAGYCGEQPWVVAGRGIFEMGANDSEIAHVLGHELSHLLLRHQWWREKWLDRACKEWSREWLRTPEGRRWLDDPSVRIQQGNDLRRLCVEKNRELYNAQRRALEADADQWAVKLIELAGFDPKAGSARLERWAVESEPGGFESHYPADIRAWLLKASEHPSSPWVPPSNQQFDRLREIDAEGFGPH